MYIFFYTYTNRKDKSCISNYIIIMGNYRLQLLLMTPI